MFDIKAVIDEFEMLASSRTQWERYWRDIARYVLPHTQQFDMALSRSPSTAINAVVTSPVAAERSKDIYDMTSLWGVERLSAGMLTLKTPESQTWHDLNVDDDYGYKPSHAEKVALEGVRDYQFRIRSNPKSGFWSAHKAGIRSMCAFGDGWTFVEELNGERVPYRYEHAPLMDLFPGVDHNGQPNRMFRVYDWSALQIANKWKDTMGPKVRDMANDPLRRHEKLRVLHAITPRPDGARIGMGTRGAKFASYYCLAEEKHPLGESGYYEFPYHRYAWNNTGTSAFCEGPVAIALGEIKSLNEMAKNELISHQQLVRPPVATAGKNMQRLNFNPGANNPGLISEDGKPLFQPLNAGVRPDFAKLVTEQRRIGLREMLYLNLWQILLDRPDMTATEALIRAQEKGELLGPVGISMNEGLSSMVDREIGILGRKGAFNEGSPLALPATLSNKNVAPHFTSPLDRLRRMGDLVGIQRLAEVVGQLAQFNPRAVARLDVDEIIEQAAEILGAPTKVLIDRDAANKAGEKNNKAQEMATLLGLLKGGGEAAKAAGDGAAAMAGGAQAAQAAAPAVQGMLNGLQRSLPQLPGAV